MVGGLRATNTLRSSSERALLAAAPFFLDGPTEALIAVEC
jgi:hypothetical protein